MAKSFKEKEENFKKKSGITPEEKAYVPQKTAREYALEMLLKHQYKAEIKDNLLYCECKDEDDFLHCKSLLLEHFGRDGKVPFSFGASLRDGFKENNEEECRFCGTRKKIGFLCMECGRI